MRAWWYGPETLPHGDGRKVAPGVTLAVKGKIELCKNGLHGSVLPLDALQYGSGHFWRTEHSGTILNGADKLCSSERIHLWRVRDTDAVLRHFARLCALDVVHLWEAPDVVVRYLKTGDEEIWNAARARDAAWAAGDAAWAAGNAAGNAAGAAGNAAGAAAGAARSAAWAAAAARTARDSAGYAGASRTARDAAWDKQNTRLHRMLMRAERVEVMR